MAISTYSELQTAVQNWLARADADIVSRAPEFIALAEAQFNRDIKHRRMEAQASLSTVANTETVALPSDYIEARSLVVQSSPKIVLSLVTPAQLYTNFPDGATGLPSEYAIIGSNIHLGRIPDAVYTITLTYYQTVPALTDSNTTNWLLTYNPDAYLYGTLLQAAPYLLNDERIPVWGALYDRAVQGIEDDSNRASWNGGPLTSRVDVSVG